MTSLPSSLPSTITIELTGPLERTVGSTEVVVDASGIDCLGDLLRLLTRRCPETAEQLGVTASDMNDQTDSKERTEPTESAQLKLPAGMLAIRDGAALASLHDTPVQPGDRITLITMISGG